jgi:type III pantothenate kinase
MPQKVKNADETSALHRKAKTLLAIDVGNTNTVVGLLKNGKLVQSWRLTTVRERTADEHAVLIRNLLSLGGHERQELEGIAISCVVPPLLPGIKDMCHLYFDCDPFIVQPGIKTGMPILYEHPQEVGADRIVLSVAGFHQYGGPCIVIDFGTATTFDAISEKGEYLGGIISPGIGISAEALFQRAAKLPRVEIKDPGQVIGRNTVAAMQSGIFYGYLGLIEKIIDLVQEELGHRTTNIATGGLSALLAKRTDRIHHLNPDLIMDGLQILFDMNR